MASPYKIILVEDTPSDVVLFQAALNRIQFDGSFYHYQAGKDFVEAFRSGDLDLDEQVLIFIDFNLPSEVGLNVAQELAPLVSSTFILISTVLPALAAHKEAYPFIAHWLEKDFEFDLFSENIRETIQKYLGEPSIGEE